MADKVNKPKRPLSAYKLFLKDSRAEIKRNNPGIKASEVAKIGGQMWHKIEDENRTKWTKKAAREKAKYLKTFEKPKRPQSAYMLFLNKSRAEIKRNNPGIKVTEVAKIGGKMWHEIEDRDKTKWTKKAAREKAKYLKTFEKPKRPQSAYMLFLNNSRAEIKRNNPGIKVTEIAKIGGKMWHEIEDEAKTKWVKKAAKEKAKYQRALKIYLSREENTAYGGDDIVKKKRNKRVQRCYTASNITIIKNRKRRSDYSCSIC